MIYIQAEDQETFLKSIGIDRVDDVEYITVDRDDRYIEWHGLYGRGVINKHRYEVRISVDGTKLWFKNDEQHRDGDLPAVIYSDGFQEWWIDDKFIRLKTS